jgi:AraC family transcriptional regulator of arabinose operon
MHRTQRPSRSAKTIENARSVRQLTARDPRILRALELFQKSTSAHVSDIAADLNLSSSRFRHLFKQELGLSPKRYLKLTRLNRAKKLLENSFLRVKEITTVLGVNDVSHFVRDYKAFYRQTPSQTRVLYRRVPRRIPVDSRYGQ